MGRQLLIALSSMVGFGLLHCVVPPSFDGYEAATEQDAGAAGGTAGTSSAGSSGSATAGVSATTAGGAGGAIAGVAGVGAGGTTDGREWGVRCSPMTPCRQGLTCLPALGQSIVSPARVSLLFTPMCVTECNPNANDGNCIVGEDVGTCVGFGSTGACVPNCDVELGKECPETSRCIHELPFEGFGLCNPRCTSDNECQWLGSEMKCRDGICDPAAAPNDPSDCTQSSCACYPDEGSGTCLIPCETDSDCPVHEATQRQMQCPQNDYSIPGESVCVVPCNPGMAGDCAEVGLALVCNSSAGRSGCFADF